MLLLVSRDEHWIFQINLTAIPKFNTNKSNWLFPKKEEVTITKQHNVELHNP
jgi:hypothetical protein